MEVKQIANPYLPGYEYVPDGEAHVFGDRVYLYGAMTGSTGKNSAWMTMCAILPRSPI